MIEEGSCFAEQTGNQASLSLSYSCCMLSPLHKVFGCSLIPLAVVRGLQLGVGLNLAQKGVSLVWFKDAKVGIIRDLSGSDSLFLGLFGAIFILLTVLPYEKLELPAASVAKQPAEELEVPQQGPEEVEGQTVTSVSHLSKTNLGV